MAAGAGLQGSQEAEGRVLIMEQRMLATGENTAPIHTSEENVKKSIFFFKTLPPYEGSEKLKKKTH